MDVKDIIKHVDHTLLTQTATWAEIRQICDDAVAYGTASVCIPPSVVKQRNRAKLTLHAKVAQEAGNGGKQRRVGHARSTQRSSSLCDAGS